MFRQWKLVIVQTGSRARRGRVGAFIVAALALALMLALASPGNTSASVSYHRWIAIWNRTGSALNDYSLEVTSQAGAGFDHAALVAAGKSQADGDDLRVEVDGVEVNRWLDGPSTAHCKVWINVTLQAPVTATLAVAFTSGDAVTTLTVDDTSGFPRSGTLFDVDSGEAFTYEAKDATRFVGVTRAAKGTTSASGSGGDMLVWIEHDVYLTYGDLTAGPPSVNDDARPAFDLNPSSNAAWVYSIFGAGLESHRLVQRWDSFTELATQSYRHNGNHGTNSDYPDYIWKEIGLDAVAYSATPGEGRYFFYNPSGITSVNFSNGEKYIAHASVIWNAKIQSSADGATWTDEYSISAPTGPGVWGTWSRNEPLNTGARYVGLYLRGGYYDGYWPLWASLEADDCTVTLNAAHTPGVAMSREVLVPIAPASVILTGPTDGLIDTNGLVDTPYTFAASVSPISATTPVTYVWSASGQSPVTHIGELTDTVSFAWPTTGMQAVTVTVSNVQGTARGNYVLNIITLPASSRWWMAIWNRAGRALNNYPIEVTSSAGAGFNHAALVAAGRSRADGNDLQVEIDGVNVDRWMEESDTTHCKVWVTMTLQAPVTATLAAVYASGDTVATLTVDDTNGFPSSGILYNTHSGEAFTYTSTDAAHFAGVARAARDTLAAVGEIGDTLVWIEHDVYFTFGDLTATPPSVNPHVKPAFRLDTSTNTVWDYAEFGEDDGLRIGQWVKQTIADSPTFYGGDRGATADPWEEIGIFTPYYGSNGPGRARWYAYNPCGIVGANFQNGERRSDSIWTDYADLCYLAIQSSQDGTNWSSEYRIPVSDYDPVYTWLSWSRDEALDDGASYVALLDHDGSQYGSATMHLEVSDVTLALNSSHTPGVVLGNRVYTPLPVALTGVVITGSEEGLAHTSYAFTATVSPLTATTPITYVWNATGQSPVIHTGGLSDVASFAWTAGGAQIVTVTTSNGIGMAGDTHTLTITVPPTPVAPTGVAIAGPMEGQVSAPYTFTATVSPISATTPITFVWEAAGQSPVTRTGGLSDAISFAWPLSGTHIITVTASNRPGTASGTHVFRATVPPVPAPPTSVVITAPVDGLVNVPHTFAATTAPITSATPITYVWSAAGQSPVTHIGGLSDTISFTWFVPGTQVVTVTASNGWGAATDTYIITIMDADSDGDGIPDSVEGVADTDGDGRPDFRDPDSDGDGVLDSIEGTTDTDGDGVPDFRDPDSDGDGILDSIEGAADTDGDGIPDYRDLDSDGDGISDSIEGAADTDGDGIPDFRDLDSDGDGVLDSIEGAADTDGDGIPDFRDLDSDNDGISDKAERRGDFDGDGLPDFRDLDSDNDGLNDNVDPDDDNDGIPDIVEGLIDGPGVFDTSIDTDSDGAPDYLDADSDDDGIPDSGEYSSGASDPLSGCVSSSPVCFNNDVDGDGVPNFRDLDSDGDGVPDSMEGAGDTDGDGIPNYLDAVNVYNVYLPIVVRNYPLLPPAEAPDSCPGVELAGNRLSAGFEHENDNDWYSFAARAGEAFRIETTALGARVDTVIELHDQNCGALLAQGDDIDYPNNLASRIIWTAQASGRYYLNVRPYDWRVYGAGAEYTLLVEPWTGQMTAAPTPQVDAASAKPPAPPTPMP